MPMQESAPQHVWKLPLEAIEEIVEAEPRVPYTEEEIQEVLKDLYTAVDNESYIQAVPTDDNPSLADDYVFSVEDEYKVLKDLKPENLVGKIEDLSKGAIRRRKQGLPKEFLYVFKYPCLLMKRKLEDVSNEPVSEKVLIYIKVNDRKFPEKRVFVISFHKNNPRKQSE